jgi:RNase P subunit RPR2
MIDVEYDEVCEELENGYCPKCGSFLEKGRSFGDGWTEQKEQEYICYDCGTIYWYGEAYGWDWEE